MATSGTSRHRFPLPVRILGFALLGVIGTVTIAYWDYIVGPDESIFDWSADDHESGTSESGPNYKHWLMMRYCTWNRDRYISTYQSPDAPWTAVSGGWPQTPADPLLPGWAVLLRPGNVSTERPNDYIVSGEALGWPFRAFAGEAAVYGVHVDDGTEFGVQRSQFFSRNAIVLDRHVLDLPGISMPLTVLPNRPLMLGFVVDVAFFGSLACLALSVITLPGRMLSRYRRRRDRCVRCGYSVAGVARCPECGLSVLGTPA